jgi:hypothetical protein
LLAEMIRVGMRRSWISIISVLVSAIALAGVVTLAFAYEKLRRQMAGISSDMARLPNPSASNEHFVARLSVIRSQLSRAERPIIVMGDSIVESALLPPTLCGHPVINAGVGGATIGFFTRYAEIIVNNSKPELVVLSVGINDVKNTLGNFRAAYLATLHSLSGPVAVVTITSTKPLMSDFNQFIRSIDGVAVIDPKDISGGMTTDGIHLDQTGYQIWNKAVVQGIEKKIGCSNYNPI